MKECWINEIIFTIKIFAYQKELYFNQTLKQNQNCI